MRSVSINGEILFFIFFGIHLLAILLSLDLMASATKPLLLLSLIAYYLQQSRKIQTGVSLIVLAALGFSLLGDVLLLFQDKQQVYFMLGLGAFLTAHVFYIIWFVTESGKRGSQMNKLYILPVVAYTVALLYFLWPGLGGLKLPVLVYGLVIATMLITAIGASMPIRKLLTASLFILYGAKLFVISDSLLAINKFYQPFAAAGFFIMLTYGLAQYLVVKGIIDRQKVKK